MVQRLCLYNGYGSGRPWRCEYQRQTARLPPIDRCEACIKARQQWIHNDSYATQVEHLEDNYLKRIEEIIEVKVKQAIARTIQGT
jgi:hypothetical protein